MKAGHNLDKSHFNIALFAFVQILHPVFPDCLLRLPFETRFPFVQVLSRGIAGKDCSVEVELSSMRKACISTFKGKHYVNVREYYEKDGSLAPGSKGLALEQSHWNVLTGLLPRLHEQACTLMKNA
jgi:hypothetical protein